MSEAVEFLENFVEGRLSRLHTAMFGVIEKYDPVKLKADVKLLVKRKYKHQESLEYPLLQEVPVSTIKTGAFVIRPPYQKGDMVLVLFAEREIDGIVENGQTKEPQSNRKHALEDAIVISGWLPFSHDLPDEHAEDLVIARTDFSCKVVLSQDNNVLIKTDANVTVECDGNAKIDAGGNAIVQSGGLTLLGSEGASEGVPLGDTLKEWLDGHTHPYTWEDPAGSGTTSPPSPSPLPSAKVKTV